MEDYLDGTCGNSGGEKKCIGGSGGLRLVYNIKMDFNEARA
jgi:hypothetical protein